MAGIEKSPKELRSEMLAWLNEVEDAQLAEAEDVALEAGIEAVEAIRETIDTTPSSLSRIPKDNRNWTGHMRSRADARVERRGNQIELQFGWFRVKKDERYIAIQEFGGQVREKQVTAMNALGAARMAAMRKLRDGGFSGQ